MKAMRINQNNLEVKYALELYMEVPGFPSQRDILYVMIRSLEDQNLIDKEFNPDNMWGALRTCFGTITEIREFLDSISTGDEPYLEKTKQDKRGGYFRLIRNPWM
jgi:hypothetical protein